VEFGSSNDLLLLQAMNHLKGITPAVAATPKKQTAKTGG